VEPPTVVTTAVSGVAAEGVRVHTPMPSCVERKVATRAPVCDSFISPATSTGAPTRLVARKANCCGTPGTQLPPSGWKLTVKSSAGRARVSVAASGETTVNVRLQKFRSLKLRIHEVYARSI
jgi:hypothetical protein